VRLFERNPLDWDTLSPALKGLIVANVIVFVLEWMVGYPFVAIFGLVPKRLLGEFWIWQPFTYLFLHGHLLHLLFNLLAIWMFGMAIESQWGAKEFLKYFFLTGVGAGLFNVLLDPRSDNPIIGASGSVYGLLTAFAMLYPDAVVWVWFFIPMRAKTMALLFGLIEFLSSMDGSKSGVANLAHLGGMVVGYAYLRWWWVAKIRINAWGKDIVSGLGSKTGGVRKARRGEAIAEDLESEVNRILDKILQSGSDSLTPEEKETMRRYSQSSKKRQV
jgi:membrane associated rhomboid family serine protease